ncbi:MAG: hypothetical protein AAGD38_15565 [Acidobacteriota bacterium]
MSPILVLFLGAALSFAAWPWLARLVQVTEDRSTLTLLSGALTLHLMLLSLDLVGIRWHSGLLVAVLLLAVLLASALTRRPEHPPAQWSSPPGWGDVVATGALGVFATLTLLQWNLAPDFIFHWGIKGKVFALTGGIDTAFLARPENAVHLHPDYPNLLPNLYATTAILGGQFSELAMATWSILWFGATLLAARVALVRLGAPRDLGLATLALVLLMFGVGYLTAGAADWLLVVALMVALASLITPPDKRGDIRLGIAAGVAAAGKIEGVVLAAVLIAVQLLRHIRRDRSLSIASIVRCAAPTLLVVVPWWWLVVRHDLFAPSNLGPLDPTRTGVVLETLWQAWLTPNWHGFTCLLLGLPWLLRSKTLRPLALVCLAQGGFYLLVYLTTPVDPAALVATSAPRLFFHLLPVTIIGLVAMLGGSGAASDRDRGGGVELGPGRGEQDVHVDLRVDRVGTE